MTFVATAMEETTMVEIPPALMAMALDAMIFTEGEEAAVKEKPLSMRRRQRHVEEEEEAVGEASVATRLVNMVFFVLNFYVLISLVIY
jgi:hypothetical protein